MEKVVQRPGCRLSDGRVFVVTFSIIFSDQQERSDHSPRHACQVPLSLNILSQQTVPMSLTK